MILMLFGESCRNCPIEEELLQEEKKNISVPLISVAP